MPEMNGKAILVRLQKEWMRKALASRFILALATAVFIAALLYKLFSSPLLLALPLTLLLFAVALVVSRNRRLNEQSVARFLNRFRTRPAGERPPVFGTLPIFKHSRKITGKKIEPELILLKVQSPFQKRLTASLLIFLLAFAVGAILVIVPFSALSFTKRPDEKGRSSVNPVAEKRLPQIKAATVTVSPPPYTGKGARQSGFNLSVEEGAVVSWQIQTSLPAKAITILFNDGTRAPLIADKEGLNWKVQKQLKASGFYGVKIDGATSELYKIEAIKDHPPTVIVQSPQPATSITYGKSETVVLKTALSDDYGITAAAISATVSSGQGEAVKFKEQKLSFESFGPGGKDYHLQKTIDCKALGMAPGDELYLFVAASDIHGQETRSDVYIITLQDTADLLRIDGMVTSLDVKQEAFRSQRQIIIETEQLLKSRTTITPDRFRQKSNDLGIDQSLLRLRYGKFLGEETNTEIGEDHHSDEAGHEGKDFTNDAAAIIEQYSHKHDIADDADFFDPATKTALKKMLDEMWNAEKKLRTFLPKEALIYENKALLLLKDLQQKSRAYVPKTGFTPTPLKLDKRLTGDLSKVGQPLTKETAGKPEDETMATRRAVGILEGLKESARLDEASEQLLQQAFRRLSGAAAGQPSLYLPALSSLKKIMADTYRVKDIAVAESGLQRLLPAAEGLPAATGAGTQNLSKQYFINISKGGRQ